MSDFDFKVGEWRWIRAAGFMLITELPDTAEEAARKRRVLMFRQVKTSVTCETPSGCNYYAAPDDVMGLATLKTLDYHEKQLTGRNLSVQGFERIRAWLKTRETAP